MALATIPKIRMPHHFWYHFGCFSVSKVLSILELSKEDVLAIILFLNYRATPRRGESKNVRSSLPFAAARVGEDEIFIPSPNSSTFYTQFGNGGSGKLQDFSFH